MKIKEFILENQDIANTVLTHAQISDLFVTLEQLANQIGSNKNLLGKITGAAQGATKGVWQGLKSAGKAVAQGANYAYNKAQGNPQYDDQTGEKLYEVLDVKEWLKGISAKRLESKWKSVGSPDSLPEVFDFLNREVGSQALVGAAFNKMGMKPQYDYIKNAVATNPNAASSGGAQKLYSQGKLVPNRQQTSQQQASNMNMSISQTATQDISQRLDNIEKRLNAANLEESVELDENLRAWFGKGKQGGAGGGGWDRYNTKGERIGKCGEKKPGEGKPKCLSKQKANQLRAKGGKKAIAAAVNKKRREDPNPDRKGGAKMVSNNIKKESLQYYVENRECPYCHGLMFGEDQITEEAKKDACYHKVKSRYKVWPSAYASGALVKCRKVGAKNWGNKSKKNEEVELDESLKKKLAAMGVAATMAASPAAARVSDGGQSFAQQTAQQSSQSQSVKVPKEIPSKSYLQNVASGKSRSLMHPDTAKELLKKHYNEEEVELDEACWKGYEKKGMKTMFGKKYPNCVKKTK